MPDETYGPKVYRKQGGDELVVASGGKITIEPGGQINFDGTEFAQAAAQADSTAAEVTDMKDDFNALLAKLRAAGILASS